MCPNAKIPQLRMREWKSNLGPDVQIICLSCDARRGMLEATGPKASNKVPHCRGRHPHLDAFYKCDQPGRLMMLGAANQWFASTVGLLALPREEASTAADLLPVLQALPPEVLASATAQNALAGFRGWAESLTQSDLFGSASDDVLWDAIQTMTGASTPPASAAASTDPTEILLPEWLVLTDEEKYTKHSGSADFRAVRRDVHTTLRPLVIEVVAVEKLKKVNAFVGFTRIDALDRIDDSKSRVAPLNRNGRPTWVPATEIVGRGSSSSSMTPLSTHGRRRSFSSTCGRRTASRTDSTSGDEPARHQTTRSIRTAASQLRAIGPYTLSHLLIREAAMSSGYGSASLTERIYAWRAVDDTPAAAGLLITTTASDSEGTLGRSRGPVTPREARWASP